MEVNTNKLEKFSEEASKTIFKDSLIIENKIELSENENEHFFATVLLFPDPNKERIIGNRARLDLAINFEGFLLYGFITYLGHGISDPLPIDHKFINSKILSDRLQNSLTNKNNNELRTKI